MSLPDHSRRQECYSACYMSLFLPERLLPDLKVLRDVAIIVTEQQLCPVMSPVATGLTLYAHSLIYLVIKNWVTSPIWELLF